jgi:tripartite-type tricarboxylate transporter receptor subunit TctC
MKPSRIVALCAFTLCAAGALAQEPYPSKPIRFVLPYSTGGGSDALTRAVADEMRKRLGQPVIVDSRPGANTMIAAEIVARSRNDGYTLLYLGWTTITTNLVTYRNIAYRLEDFQPITTLYRSPLNIVVRKDFPASNLKELVEYARSKGSLAYGTAGAGSSPNLLVARLSRATGVKFEHVAYKGEAPAVLDVMGGHLPMFAGSLSNSAPHIRAGALKVIVTSSGERLPSYPDVPTIREAGFEDQVFTYWHGVAAPAGTPRAIIDRLHAAIVAAMDLKRVRDVLEGDQIPTTMSPEAFGELIRRDIATWGPVIRANNLVQ